MIIEKIEIRNFRSIESIDICPNPACQGFVGLNESGKTNILAAITMLSLESVIDKNDARNSNSEDGYKQPSYIRYFFKLENDETEFVVSKLNERIYIENICPKIAINRKEISISDFFSERTKGVYICNIKKEEKYASYFSLNETDVISIDGLLKMRNKGEQGPFLSQSGKTVDMHEYDFFEASCFADIYMDNFENCTTDDINNVFGDILHKYINEHLPSVMFWRFSDKYMLPNSIPLQEFCDNPNISIPLKAMFNIAGFSEIETLLSDALSKRANILTGILEKVSQKSTEYLHNVWQAYQKVSFELRKDGDNLVIYIQDIENYYDLDQRSDGFKRFIAFLLTLSAGVTNGNIKNAIIAIDEPDMGIHIKGQKDLLQELIKMSKDNLVFYSSHSIFMIDRGNPSRHFMVKKDNETTTIEQASESNYTDDEVLFNALGYSVFETLSEVNIIFEGWSDKHVFELALGTNRGKNAAKLKGIGKIHSTGVKTIISIAKVLELANRKYIVLSDSDEPSQQRKKDYMEKEQCAGKWLTYNTFTVNVYTLEDYIKHTSFKKSIEKARKENCNLDVFDYDDFKNKVFQRESYIRAWITKTTTDVDSTKSILRGIKNHLYSNLKGSDIEDSYFELLDKLKSDLGL